MEMSEKRKGRRKSEPGGRVEWVGGRDQESLQARLRSRSTDFDLQSRRIGSDSSRSFDSKRKTFVLGKIG